MSKVPQGQSLALILIYILTNELREKKKNKTGITMACFWHKCEKNSAKKK